ncbi:MAG TPA: flagellar basal body P-ring formation chaperone FlgA [Tichowtungia sp.]|nr:flagellar basal body P-ring formation chaperone FlgA [Tichowtungia sp.]
MKKRISRRMILLIFGLGMICHPEMVWEAMAAADTAQVVPQGVRIEIAPEVSVSADKIYLRDIATLTGETALTEIIGNIYLRPAPRLGQKSVLSGAYLARRIQAGQPSHIPLKLEIPENVAVHRKCQTVSEAQLAALFHDHVQTALPEADLEIRRFHARGLRSLPPGTLDLTIEPQNHQDLTGAVHLKVDVAVDGCSAAKVYLSAWVDQFAEVVCARRALRRDTILREADLGLQRKNISRTPSNMVVSLEQAVGKRLRQSVSSGDYLRDNMLEVPPLIFRGDRVRLIAQKGALIVETLGIAKERGTRGEQIRVGNVSSGKTVVGRVVAPSTVRILF